MIAISPELIALFSSGFISATLLPGGSEALLIWYLSNSDIPPLTLVVAVTSGNVLGSVVTWGMGYWLSTKTPENWLEKPARKRALKWLEKWGAGALLLAWLPIVGDPLCLMAGWLRTHFLFSVLMILLGKSIRYLLLAGLF